MNPQTNISIDFQKLFEASPDVYLVLSPDFTIVAATEERLKATMTTRGDIMGKGLFEVFPDNPDDPNASGVANLKASLKRVLENKTADAMAPQKYDIPRPESEGGGFEERYWSPLNLPVLDDNGELIYIIHRVEDITEFMLLKKKGAELKTRTEQMESEIYLRAQQLQEANKKLRESEKIKDEFFANVSHELRTPLSLIIAPLESLLSGQYGTLSTGQLQSLQIMHNNTIRLLQMVNGLLDFAKFEAGKMKVEREPINIKTLINSPLNDFQSILGSKKLTLVKEVTDAVKQVLMDKYLFDRIFFNLLSNAVKFTPEGGTITVKTKIEDNILELSVADTGMGIAEEDIKNLFQKFKQVEGSSTRRFEGTGLGLAMVKEFSELLGGSVSVKSSPGKGSIFTVRLSAPFTEEEEKKAEQGRTTLLPRYRVGATEIKENNNSDAQMKVLICEDNEELSAYIVSLLAPICVTKVAKDGEEGWGFVNTWQPNLVLTDVMMPKKDGLELCRLIKSTTATSKITVVLLTALTHRDAMMKGWEVKADEYLFKPFHPDELVTRIRSLLSVLAEKKKSSEVIEKYISQLEQTNKEMETFSYAISHDLRAPLRAIMGFSSIIREDYYSKLDNEGQRLIDTVISNTQKMSMQIEDLLKFMRFGKENLKMSVFPMEDLVKKVIADINQLTQHKAEIIIHPMPSVNADYGLMTAVFYNLISNAIKYSLKKNAPKIEIGYTETDRGAAFFIKDNGAGFDMKYYDKLFGIFQRLHSGEEFEGTGIGLAIVDRIISKHGGAVWAQGKVNEGATFYFSLPKT
jgi:signal transduction histidine kinase